MRFRLGINRWKAIQALVWAVFAIGWGAVGTSVAVHFHLEDLWSGIAIFAGPLIFYFLFLLAVFCKLSGSSVRRAVARHPRQRAGQGPFTRWAQILSLILAIGSDPLQ